MSMKARTFFITGTDTDAGKTYAACALLQAAKAKGLSTAVVKPIAAGGIRNAEGLHNEDALLLQTYCTFALTYQEINPLCLELAIAPHLAARQAGVNIQAKELAAHCRAVMNKQADLTLIEGAGGWLVPLNDQECVADIVKTLNVPVILVVGMRLGCLNHALLTARAIQDDGVLLHGWIANQIDPQMPAFEENLETLETLINAPLLAVLPWNKAGGEKHIQMDNFF